VKNYLKISHLSLVLKKTQQSKAKQSKAKQSKAKQSKANFVKWASGKTEIRLINKKK
jgi:hypothetical protein